MMRFIAAKRHQASHFYLECKLKKDRKSGKMFINSPTLGNHCTSMSVESVFPIKGCSHVLFSRRFSRLLRKIQGLLKAICNLL